MSVSDNKENVSPALNQSEIITQTQLKNKNIPIISSPILNRVNDECIERLDFNSSEVIFDKSCNIFFSIVNQSSNAVVITNTSNEILYVNTKFEELSGYTLDEVMGENPRILKSNKTSNNTYQMMNRALTAGEQWKGEFINIHRNGTEYVEEAVISPIKNKLGEIVFFLGEKKDITALKSAEKKIHHIAYFDVLTDLPNRRYFIEKAKNTLSLSDKSKHKFSVLFADLNRFKELNDTYGHLTGDKALQNIAKRFLNVLSSDDLLARVGGDEFVILHRHTSTVSVIDTAKKISDSLSDNICIDGQEHHFGVSIGSSSWPSDGETLSQLLVCADLAMYKAKSAQKAYYRYDSELGANKNRKFKLSRQLKSAIEKQQLSLVYQPKNDLKSKHIIGAEVLLRWDEPDYGSVSPVEFIPIAENNGLMHCIGNWVLKEACKQLNNWKLKGYHLSGRLAINISIRQIEHLGFYDQIISILKDEHISPAQIELEVTETVLISNPDKVSNILTSLVRDGFSIAIDDFGTGYSSLSYLKKIQASILKIDKSFIDNINIDKKDRAIVKSVINLSHSLDLKVVAEGVENKEQETYLTSIGCDMAQGYFYSKPLTANKFAERCMQRYEKKGYPRAILNSNYKSST